MHRTRAYATGLTAAFNYVMQFVATKTYYNLEMILSVPGVAILYGLVALFGYVAYHMQFYGDHWVIILLFNLLFTGSLLCLCCCLRLKIAHWKTLKCILRTNSESGPIHAYLSPEINNKWWGWWSSNEVDGRICLFFDCYCWIKADDYVHHTNEYNWSAFILYFRLDLCLPKIKQCKYSRS